MRPLVIAGFVLAAVLPAAFTLDPAFDHDTWWHLAVGRSIRTTGTVPTHDAFSQLGRDRPTPWLAYSWLYELGLYEAYLNWGEVGILGLRTILGAISTTALFAFIARRLGVGWQGVLFTVLAGIVLMPLMKERPWHLTIVFTVVTAECIARLRNGAALRHSIWLPLVYVLWANVHIQFVLGWLLLGLACLFPGRARRTTMMLLALLCCLATFVNPYHVRLFGVIADYATQTGPLRSVQELAPADFASPWTWAGIALVLWSGFTALRRQPLDWFALSFLAIGLILSLRMRRDGWIAILAAAVAMRPLTVELGRGRWVALIVAVTFAAVRIANYYGLGPPNDPAAGNARVYPVVAVDRVRTAEYPGPLFNPFDWGGYLIWALPEYPVSMDGRTNLYGSERVVRNMATCAGEPGWEHDPELLAARVVIAPRYGALAERLKTRSEWRVVFEDETAVVFVANRP